MMPKKTAAIVALCNLSVPQVVGAFTPSAADGSSARTQTRLMAEQQQNPQDRRAFVAGVISSAFGAAAIISMPAWAEEEKVDDLAMPTAEEQKALDDAAMAERLKRKAELQKKMSRPMNYQESMKAEQSRQKDMKKSKQEMRNALCEELGRGC